MWKRESNTDESKLWFLVGIDGQSVEWIRTHTYLGIRFHNSERFILCMKHLAELTKKAMYELRRK